MKGILILLLLPVLLLISLTLAEEHTVVLTDKNFDETLKKHEIAIVEFYAPWCGHCKKLAPEYEKAAGALKSTGILVAKVDATVEQGLGQRFSIEGYPTLKVFRSGVASDYPGERSADAIISYLKKQLEPAIKVVENEDKLTSILDLPAESIEIIAYAEPSSDLQKFIETFAKKFREEYSFSIVSDPSIAVIADEKMGTIVLYKSFDEHKVVYDQEFTDEAFISFLKNHSLPLVNEISPKNYKKYVDRGLPFAWLFINPDDKQAADDAKAIFGQIAPDYAGQLSFVYLNGVQYQQMMPKMGVNGDKMPALAIENKEGQHYVFEETNPFTLEKVKEFFAAFNDGSLKPRMKSEPIPSSPYDENNVRIVVGDNFKEVVMDTEKDVLVEFYAPWCGHCKKLAPIYGELATDLKSIPTIVIAKTDATTNDFPAGFNVQGFPTIQLVTAGTNTIIEYNGARTKADLISFLKTNCVHAFEVPESAAAGNENDWDKDEF